MTRARLAAPWLLAATVCLVLYWPGLGAWFQQDDFAWLGLEPESRSPGGVLRMLFAPMAQGTIRPWSERVFFLVFRELFGIDALPFRIWVLLTQVANVALVTAIGRRLTGSGWAGAAAAILWTVNTALAKPMSWTSAYNQVLCAFFVLLAFLIWLRYIDTGERRWYVRQWIVFVLGFGALEINVVYPALAAGYALARARPYWRRTLPMFAVSAVYVVVHQAVAPRLASGPYVRHWDVTMASTLLEYWKMALGSGRVDHLTADPYWTFAAQAVLWATSLAMLAFAAWRLRTGDLLPAFLLGWFVIAIAPVLPLRDHVSDYYLTLPAIGLGLFGAVALASRKTRVPAVVCAALYAGLSVPVARQIQRIYVDRSKAVRNLVLGVVRARELHPRSMILLSGVDTPLFWSGVLDNPFRLFGVKDVYLTPGSEAGIQAFPELGDVSEWVIPADQAKKALTQYQAEVYSVAGSRLRNVTTSYLAVIEAEANQDAPRVVDVGQARFADLLGAGWYAIEDGFRWMSRRAVLRLAGPRQAGEKLRISGFAPARLLAGGPVHVRVAADGSRLPAAVLKEPDAPFELDFPLPDGLTGRKQIEIVVELDNAFALPPDVRELGVRLGTVALRQ